MRTSILPLLAIAAVLLAGSLAASPIQTTAAKPSASSWPGPIIDKTPPAWIYLSNLTQQGGSLLPLFQEIPVTTPTKDSQHDR